MIGLNHHQSELRERGLDMIKTLFSRQFVVAFLLTLLCSLAGSFLGGLPYLSVIGALVITLILGMLMQFAQPAVAYSQHAPGPCRQVYVAGARLCHSRGVQHHHLGVAEAPVALNAGLHPVRLHGDGKPVAVGESPLAHVGYVKAVNHHALEPVASAEGPRPYRRDVVGQDDLPQQCGASKGVVGDGIVQHSFRRILTGLHNPNPAGCPDSGLGVQLCGCHRPQGN